MTKLKVIEGKEYYSPRLGKRVKVGFVGGHSGLVYVRDTEGNSYSVRVETLQEIEDNRKGRNNVSTDKSLR